MLESIFSDIITNFRLSWYSFYYRIIEILFAKLVVDRLSLLAVAGIVHGDYLMVAPELVSTVPVAASIFKTLPYWLSMSPSEAEIVFPS